MSFTLASASPRRRQLLAHVGLEPPVVPSHVDETPRPGEPPVAYALRVAEDKARACPATGAVLAADTVVDLDDTICGKAADEAEARAMLARLSGQTHQVHTAVVLRDLAGGMTSLVVSTRVRFRTLSEAEIARYVAGGEPMDKAGAYGIQGEGGALVAWVEGSYTNVVGLPLEETLELLAQGGLR
ncbi:MAG: septum formation inhibitor Maf [Myxococcales bacterium]|nr:septum formation inhibitor Maf [Myxococcales bacterium]